MWLSVLYNDIYSYLLLFLFIFDNKYTIKVQFQFHNWIHLTGQTQISIFILMFYLFIIVTYALSLINAIICYDSTL